MNSQQDPDNIETETVYIISTSNPWDNGFLHTICRDEAHKQRLWHKLSHETDTRYYITEVKLPKSIFVPF